MNHDFHWLLVLGRLKPGVTIQQAQANMNTVAAHIAEANPKSNKGWGVGVEPLKDDFLDGSTKLTLWLLLGAVGFLLLIACVNVANLLLAKGITRQKEIAIRSAVGASRRTVFAQFVTQSLVMAGIGGVAGVGLGYVMLRGLVAAMPAGTLPIEADLHLNLPVLLVTLAVTTLAGLIFGCAPAWYASRVDPYESLKEGGRTGSSTMRNRLRQLLVVGEFSLALTLLTGAGLAIHSFWKLMHIDLGVQTDHVLTFGLPMTQQDSYNSAEVIGHYQQILRSVEAAPGVQSASASVGLPLEGAGFGMPFTIAGQPAFDRSLAAAGGRIPDGDAGLLQDVRHPRDQRARLHRSGHRFKPARGHGEREICRSVLAWERPYRPAVDGGAVDSGRDQAGPDAGVGDRRRLSRCARRLV